MMMAGFVLLYCIYSMLISGGYSGIWFCAPSLVYGMVVGGLETSSTFWLAFWALQERLG